MADKEYQKEFGIKTVRVPISEVHCKVRSKDDVVEYEEIIIKTKTMTKEDFINLSVYSWCIQLEHSLGHNLSPTLKQYEYLIDIARGITEGKQRCREWKGIYYEPEEMLFLEIYKDIPNIEQKLLYGRKGKGILNEKN